MTISAPRPLDQPADVRLSGLPAGATTTVTASATDDHGVRWSAHADFRADAGGVVSLAQRPVGGDYDRADPMGLVESLAPGRVGEPVFATTQFGGPVMLAATVDGRTVATGTLRRLGPDQTGVTSTDLRPATDTIFGTLYEPKDTSARHAAVVVFGGSEGGLARYIQLEAAELAEHGHPALALAYFAEPGLPPTLDRIPLEYFTRALSILRARPGVDPTRLYVMGGSRGGEAALLLAATYPSQIHGVVGQVPASTVNAAFVIRAGSNHSAWTVHGREVPFTRAFQAPAAAVDPAAVIPVERIRGPMLLTCGGQDTEWPSCANVDDITGRLAAHHVRPPVTVLKYSSAGHFATTLPPYTVYSQAALTATGGEVAATQQSNVDFWAHLLPFLGP